MEASLRNQQTTPELNMSFEVDDPYDPSRPNDYLAYCEERLDQQRQKDLAEENIRKFAEIERHREQMEKERAEAIQSGDTQRIQKVAMGAGWSPLYDLILYVNPLLLSFDEFHSSYPPSSPLPPLLRTYRSWTRSRSVKFTSMDVY